MGTVKYTGPVASFHCPTNAEIRSLKVHFSPKQLGEGDPSPENVRPIVGWDGVETYQTGKNLIDERFLSDASNYTVAGNYGYVYTEEFIQLIPNTKYRFVWFYYDSDKIGGTSVNLYCDGASEYIINNSAYRQYANGFTTNSTGKIRFGIFKSSAYATIQDALDAIFGNGKLLLQIGIEDILYEPYHGSTTNYEFGVLGKNKFPLTASTAIENIKTGYDNTIVRDVTSTSIYQNVSANNYWIGSTTSSYISNVGNGEITFSSSDGSYGAGMFVPVTPNQTYIISDNSEKARFRVGYYNDDGTFSGQHFIANKAFTIPTEYHYAFIVIVPLADYYSQEITVSNIQLELGSAATAYEPYDPNKTVYGGWVDLVSGEVASTYIHCKIKNLPGEWNYRSGNNRFQITLTGNYANAASSGGIWTHFATSEVYATSTSNGYGNKQIATYIDKHIYIRDDDFEGDVEAFLNGVGDTYVTYELAESTTYSLSPTQLQTFLGQNNVWSNADYVEVEYDLHETQDILNRKNFIIANQPHVVKPAAAPLQNFATDVPAPLKECKVHFSPVQEGSGDPSPENVRPIIGWDGVEVYRMGKNLFDKDAVINNSWIRAGNLSEENPLGAIREKASGYTLSSYIPVYPNTAYTIKYNITSLATAAGMVFFSEQDANSAISGISLYYQTYINSSTTREYYTFTTPTNCYYIRISIPPNASEVQLELGSTTTDYEPYNGTAIPITFPTEAGTVYGGYVDLVTGGVWKTWDIIDLGTCTWIQYSNNPSIFYTRNLNNLKEYSNQYTVLCTAYPYEQQKNVTATNDKTINDSEQLNRGNVAIRDTNYTNSTPAEFKEAMNGIICAYKLATPILITTLTPTQLKTLRGTNNIWSNANGDIELSYWKH